MVYQCRVDVSSEDKCDRIANHNQGLFTLVLVNLIGYFRDLQTWSSSHPADGTKGSGVTCLVGDRVPVGTAEEGPATGSTSSERSGSGLGVGDTARC